MVVLKEAKLQSLVGMQRVVRVHCLMDTNVKVQVRRKDTREVMFGSTDLDPSKFEKRIVVFENQEFRFVDQPMVYDREVLQRPDFIEMMELRTHK